MAFPVPKTTHPEVLVLAIHTEVGVPTLWLFCKPIEDAVTVSAETLSQTENESKITKINNKIFEIFLNMIVLNLIIIANYFICYFIIL